MDELHGYRPLTHSGSHAFHRTMPHIAYCKNSGNVCLQQKGISVQRHPLRARTITYEIWTSQNEPALVPLNNSGKPVRSRQGSNKDEHAARRHALNLVGIRTKEGNLFQMGLAVHFGYARVGPNLDVRRLLYLIDQIL